MKILITGSNGLLGTECTNFLGNDFDVVPISSKSLDITNKTDIKNTLEIHNPDIVMNCAAYTNVDKCESDRDLAYKVNVIGPRYLANCLNDTGAKLVHISTDYVFDGGKTPPDAYTETDIPNPVNHYGSTKLEGEKEIENAIANHLIVRTSWLYGIYSNCFPKTILRIALDPKYEEIKVVNDQFGCPTSTYEVANILKFLIESELTGLYHFSSEGFSTWYDFADYFLKKMDLNANIIPCSTEEYPTDAERPLNTILSNKKLFNEGFNSITDWKTQVDNFVSENKESLINETKN